MIIKKYLVKNINEAMSKIRYELGKDAIIISQRKVRKSGFAGLFSGKLIEVTAAVETSVNEEKKDESHKQNIITEEDEFKKSIESIKKLMENEIAVTQTKEKSSELNNMIKEHNSNVEKERQGSLIDSLVGFEDNDSKTIQNDIYRKNFLNNNNELSVESVHKEVEELKTLINKVIENKTAISEEIDESIEEVNLLNLDSLKEQLNNLDIDEDFYDDVINMALDYKDEDISETEILRDIFERDILVTNKGLNGKVVLVGPTGVGKTTTIAKLAGRLALVEKKKVGLITIDTYRIGAIEQLKTYAEIMNIPFKVVITIKEMENAIESMEDCDVVLIDTTGRSSKNTMQISELRAFVQKANPDHVNMVISATTKNKDIKGILKGYSELGYESVIVTKLDETTAYGSIYNISRNSNKPISFITIGQNVPDDIKLSTKEELTRFILGEETLC
ncbi:flagellar biosynthesis protein FlhF [Clostridium butyricum]|uniref:Flagellar biosynthesis protein FlhF n=1 Tax=Clostridium butyricum TaxID=1492 RepID=A0AAP9RI58_CLOBU|nr:flagellar biosynthesis protein FlhF [Clostridium butyricum]MBZ5745220.1 flagellar biosynthesis protein FlhF [Clostridium butyricum]QMW92091.1 flagellar biosynthesis protein FlhF [Clostridium butyricum]BBK75668.1 flagellar biosynthesis regulator FlhF [Clostridium butyricum]GEQ24049.1 flagellar biosynthesis regulator FlhF [Clostridium butyricum]